MRKRKTAGNRERRKIIPETDLRRANAQLLRVFLYEFPADLSKSPTLRLCLTGQGSARSSDRQDNGTSDAMRETGGHFQIAKNTIPVPVCQLGSDSMWERDASSSASFFEYKIREQEEKDTTVAESLTND
uniref:Uncharacterized protein n=1 Tax=Pristionchus pacificus TaxID=54126 RepID=A0A2A6C7U9_PRIPA|eukprot:PDM74148.1 hypothetical protein PRIPAC_41504 [Pristionchus pacificus]